MDDVSGMCRCVQGMYAPTPKHHHIQQGMEGFDMLVCLSLQRVIGERVGAALHHVPPDDVYEQIVIDIT